MFSNMLPLLQSHKMNETNCPSILHSQSKRRIQQSPQSWPLFFSEINKISALSLERRIDYHLQRIMKQNRLINFKNSIESLPIEDRINESLLEIIASSNNLIQRRRPMIQTGLALLKRLKTLAANERNQTEAFHLMVSSFGNIKHICSSLGQLIWALNSNKEHVKYVVKVFALSNFYCRPGPEVEYIALKQRICLMVAQCEQTIHACNHLKKGLHDVMVRVFVTNSEHLCRRIL